MFSFRVSKNGFINIHASLLPKWRGAAPIQRAIMNSDKLTGISIMKIVEKLDAGPVMKTEQIHLNQDMNTEQVSNILSDLSSKTIIKCIDQIENGKSKFIEQDDTQATYAKKITSKHRKINFNNDVKIIYDQIRSFAPKPSAWFILNNERINIIKCSMKICKAEASTIMNRQFHIVCKNGIIIPEIIQREGKKSMIIGEFLKGFR